jgi:hypothetical protein
VVLHTVETAQKSGALGAHANHQKKTVLPETPQAITSIRSQFATMPGSRPPKRLSKAERRPHEHLTARKSKSYGRLPRAAAVAMASVTRWQT